MYTLTIESVFSAAHALSVSGVREPVHGHDWRVTAAIEGPELDNDGLLADFHTIKGSLDRITGDLNTTNLNEAVAFEGANPTAERVAQFIAESLHDAVDESLAPYARVAWVRVTESPGCACTYTLGGGPAGG